MDVEQIRALRESRGWTQKRLAEEVGVSRASVVSWESGKAVPSRLAMRRLEEIDNRSPLEQGVTGGQD